MKNFLKTFTAIGLLGIALPALSTNFDFLYNSPVKHLSKSDWKIIENMSDSVLDNAPNHKKVTWHNPQSKNSGYLEALDKTQQNGMACRHLKFFYQTAYGNGQDVYKFCKFPQGWKIP